MTEEIRLDCLRLAHAAACKKGRGRMAAENWLAAEQRVQHLVALGHKASVTKVIGLGRDEIVLVPKGDGGKEIDAAIMAAQDACENYRATQMSVDDVWGYKK